MKNQNNKYDFKNFLLSLKKTDYAQEELIFWQNKIPLPLDLIYSLFDSKNDLFSSYLDHLLGVLLYANLKKDGLDLIPIDSLPDKKFIIENKSDLEKRFKYAIKNDLKLVALRDSLCAELGILSYKISVPNLLNALSHDGKKYSRIYIHQNLKQIIEEYNPNVLSLLGVKNDFFGNVICDFFNIYRSGFSDAFSKIFNHLIQFEISRKPNKNSNKNIVKFIEVESSQQMADLVEYTDYLGGRIWEPLYRDGVIGVRINNSHVFINSLSQNELDKLIPLLLSLSEEEYNSKSDKKTKFLEDLREDISRGTRLKIES